MRNADTRRDARELALQALTAGGTQAALDSVLRPERGGAKQPDLDPRERALATQLTYGVVKMRRALTWSLEKYLRKPLQSLDPALQNVLLLGAYQMLYLKKIPAHSAVDESVRLARRHGHSGTAGVANAVLRKLSAQPLLPPAPSGPDDIAGFGVYASVPDWLAHHWIERFGFTTALRIADGINASARRALRVNTTRVSASALQAELAVKNLQPHTSRYDIPACVVLDELGGTPAATLAQLSRLGLITVQSEESQLAVHLLNPQRDEIVLDVCAGRGVKAGAMGQRIHPDSSKLYALDDNKAKLALLNGEFRRLGLNAPNIVCCDAKRPYPPPVPRSADALLLDAPCSAIGTVGRRAEVRWIKDAGDPARLAGTQLALLSQAAQSVRAGGRLLYAVCSTAREENEDVVNAFLAHTKGWRSTRLALLAPEGTILRLGDYALTIPGIEGADGFFYALLERAEGAGLQAQREAPV